MPRYLELLAAGSSLRPDRILAEIGIDISRKEFWQGGIRLIRENVEKAKELAAAIS